jgi:hypothetical protein
MKLLSFMHNGKAYALLISDQIVLYTKNRALVFSSHYEAINWLKHK